MLHPIIALITVLRGLLQLEWQVKEYNLHALVVIALPFFMQLLEIQLIIQQMEELHGVHQHCQQLRGGKLQVVLEPTVAQLLVGLLE